MDVRLAERLHAVTHVFDPPLGQGNGPTFAVKDLIDVAGVATGGGGRVPLSHPTQHAFAVEALLAAGYRCVAKTHTVELAYGGWGTNRAVGAPWNPWDSSVHRAPGGSSSGSAVAVAAGLCDLALGTDTGGSVRIPAHACGVVGLKPGRGAVPLLGVHDLAPSLDTLGVLARDVATAVRALGILSVDRPFDVEAALRKPVSGLRVAALRPADLPELEPGVARLYAEALEKLSVSGVIVQEVTPSRPMTAYFGPNGALMAAEGWRVRGAHIQQNAEQMDPWIVRRFRAGEHVTDAQLAAALDQRAADQAEFTSWINDFDALVCPTAPIVAPPIDTVDETTSPLSSLTRAANWLDLPAASVPCGLADGLPAGFQIIGGPQDEISVIALAAAFESVSGWNGRGPDLRGFT